MDSSASVGRGMSAMERRYTKVFVLSTKSFVLRGGGPLEPIYDCKPLDSLEFTCIVGDEDGSAAQGGSSDEYVQRTDRRPPRLQVCTDSGRSLGLRGREREDRQ